MKKALARGNVVVFIGLSLVALVWLLPTLILINGAISTSNKDIYDLRPHEITFSNFVDVWAQTPLPRLFFNSIIVTLVSVLLVVLIGSCAGFGLALFPFKGDGAVQLFLLAGIMLAPAAVIIPMYNLVYRLHLLNTFPALIGPYTAIGLPIAILLFKNAFSTVPHELFESARVDGARASRVYASIYLPLSLPTIMTVIVVQSLLAWNDYLFALLFMSDTKKQTVQLAYLAFQGQFLSSLPKQFAVMTLVMAPVVVLFAVAQRAFVKGLTAGALK